MDKIHREGGEMPEKLKVLDLFSGILPGDSHLASNALEWKPWLFVKSIHSARKYYGSIGQR